MVRPIPPEGNGLTLADLACQRIASLRQPSDVRTVQAQQLLHLRPRPALHATIARRHNVIPINANNAATSHQITER